MNLADAIRRAGHVPSRVEEKATSADAFHSVVEVEATVPIEDKEILEGLNLSTGPGPGLIKLELFLPPDQLHRLIRSVAATQHNVMTLRESASYLRIPTARLEELAAERKLPGFQVDGKWRFSRARLEEWVAANHLPREQAS
jgi:excisionase family DNA binding protein